MRAEAGCMIAVESYCFDVGQEAVLASKSSNLRKPQISTTKKSAKPSVQETYEELYCVQIIFDRPACYVAIPWKQFQASLKECPLEFVRGKS